MRLTDRVRAAARAFLLGPLVVERWETSDGHQHDWSPAEYGDYLATSNGVYTCATLRASMLASLPLTLYRGIGESRTKQEQGNLYNLLNSVNPFWTRNRLIEMTELTLCLWGQAFWFLERGPSGTRPPTEMYWARPDRVTVIPDPVKYIGGFIYTPGNGAQPMRYSPGEVIWLRYPNPLDEYAGLSPLGAARIAADLSSAAMHSNKNVFKNGNQMGGALLPPAGMTLTDDQAKELEASLDRRFAGVDKAHKWGVFKFDAQLKQMGWAPKDAEFLGTLKWSLEDICRAYHVPLDLVGGQRTYENVEGAQRAMWDQCILPEGRFISGELKEQLLPMFPGEADDAEFDTAGVAVLQEAQDAAWTRAQGQLTSGAITVNEYRKKQGMPPVPWGDVWWGSSSLKPIEDAEAEPVPAPLAAADQPSDEDEADQDEQEEEPPEQMPRQAVIDELKRWQRKTLKRGPAATFESAIIPPGIRALVSTRLKADAPSAWEFLRAIDETRLKNERHLMKAIVKVLELYWGLSVDAILASQEPDWDAFSGDMVNAIDDVLAGTMTEQMLRVAIKIGIDLDPAIANIAAWRWARQYSYTLVKGITETTRDLVSEAVSKFVSTPGMTVGEVRDLLEFGFSPVRAEMIATTEVTRAYRAATSAYKEMLDKQGIVMERVWSTSSDDRVCELCCPLDGKPESEWPAGTAAPLHVNCRCSEELRYVGQK